MEIVQGSLRSFGGDLQDPPEVSSSFVEKWREGNDVVYGRRVRREMSSGQGSFTNRFISFSPL
jgi:dolichol-phosphate mannosyltransferase